MTQNSRDALRRKNLDFAHPSETDRYNAKDELKSVKRPYDVKKGEVPPRAADRRTLTSDDQ
jgi:hypothetical protein